VAKTGAAVFGKPIGMISYVPLLTEMLPFPPNPRVEIAVARFDLVE